MEEEGPDLGSNIIGHRCDFAFTLSEFPAAFLQFLRTRHVTIATALPDLFREGIDLRSQIVALGGDPATLLVEFGDASEVAQRALVSAPRQRGPHGGIVGTDSAYVDHSAEP